MERKLTALDGARAGLLAGLSVIALFLVYDAARLAPLATPMELSRVLFGTAGPGLGVTESGLARVTVITRAAFRIFAYTTLHLAVFAGLGAAAALLSERYRVAPNVVIGAVFGVTACTLLLVIAFILVWPTITLAGLSGILVANTVAGAIMGLYLQGARRTV